MNWDKYKTRPTPACWRSTMTTVLPKPRPSSIEGFVYIKTPTQFDISDYAGDYPVGVVCNCDTVVGWTSENTAKTYLELEPWASNPPPPYYYRAMCPQFNTTVEKFMALISERVTMLKEIDVARQPNPSFFEQSRHALWTVILVTKCYPIEKLIEKEVAWMRIFLTTHPELLTTFKAEHQLEAATIEHVEQHIRSMYERGKCDVPAIVPTAFQIITRDIPSRLD